MKHYASNRRLSIQEKLELDEVATPAQAKPQDIKGVYSSKIQEIGYNQRYSEFETTDETIDP